MAKRRIPNRNPDHGKGLLKRQAGRLANIPSKQDVSAEKYALMNFEITWDLMPDSDVEALPKATRERMDILFDFLHEDPASITEELRELAVRHPNVPSLRNWLISSLRAGTASDRAEALAISEHLFEQRPDYFFSRTTLAELWLNRGDIEKAAALMFGPELVLTRLYPERTVFHISEIRHWAYVCGKIKVLQSQPEAAKGYRDMLALLEPDSDAVQHLDDMLSGEGSLGKMIAALKRLSDNAKESLEKRAERKLRNEVAQGLTPDGSFPR